MPFKVSLSSLNVRISDTLRCNITEEEFTMCELPPGHIEIRRGQQRYPLWLTPDMHSLLRLYAQSADTSITDVGNRIILGFLTKAYGFETPGELRKRILKAIFPNKRAFYDALWSIAHRQKPRRRPIPLRKDGKLPSFLTESGSSGQDSP